MRVLVLGNCQARPVAQLLATGCGDVEDLPSIILHLARDDQAAEHEVLMDQADLILAQLTSATFRPAHLISAAIKARHPDKTLIWPNLFYAGQQPYLNYVSHAGGDRIMGPLDAYHDLRILRAWFAERFATEMPDTALPDPEDVHAAALQQLGAREAQCDVGICDLIETERHRRRLFFTFNHPSRWLLEALCARISDSAGLDFTAERVRSGKEPLGVIVPPPTLGGQEDTELLGVEILLDPAGRIRSGPRRTYTRDALRAAFWTAYDHQQDRLADRARLRFTPTSLQSLPLRTI